MFGGRAGDSASPWQAWGPGAQCGYHTWERGQEKHPQHLQITGFSFFREISIWASHIHTYVCLCIPLCVRIFKGRNRSEHKPAAVNGWAAFLLEGSGGALPALMRPRCAPSGHGDPLYFSFPGRTAWWASPGWPWHPVRPHPASICLPGAGWGCFGGPGWQLEKDIRSRDLVSF